MDKAIAYKHEHPESTYAEVAERFHVPWSTLYDRMTGTHAAPGDRVHKNLSTAQEAALVDKINAYAERGTLLSPHHIKDLAERLCEHPVGKNWTSTFERRCKDQISPKYYRIQDVARIKADTPENRQAFYALVKEVYDSGLYTSENIYNMDETPIEMTTTRRARRVGPASAPSTKAQAALPKGPHTTLVACISTRDAPVPPLLIYTGQDVLEEWTQARDPAPIISAGATESGWSNSYITLKWLIEIFDEYTKERAGSNRRLLFLDGAGFHDRVEFLEACWERNIVCFMLPASLTSIFQPLDVNFFGRLKQEYHTEVDNYQLGSNASRVTKAYIFPWVQRAWARTTTSRQIRAGWAEAGLYPLDQAAMRAEVHTPEPELAPVQPNTPYSLLARQDLDRKVRRKEIDPLVAYFKLSKALHKAESRIVLLEDEIGRRDAAVELDKKARESKKRATYPHGQFFDMRYQDEHAEELAARKVAEEEAKRKKRAAEQAERQRKRRARTRQCTPGPSNTVQSS